MSKPKQQDLTKKNGVVDLKSELLPIREPKCKICVSPIRDSIDRLAAAGYGPTAIAQEVMGKDPLLSTRLDTLRKNIARHTESHLKIKQKAIRQILENRKRQQGILNEDIETVFVDERGLLDGLILKGMERISDDGYQVYMKDALEAIKVKKELDQAEFSEQIKIMEKQVWSITQAIKDVVPEAMFAKITQRARQLFEGEVIDLPYVQIEDAEFKELDGPSGS